ncbi:deaminase domain-containing protein [Romboutsia sp. 1001713B170207_170306_H8]|uniref:deaminase domain-containing protein n=1 Tax=Romboutsia sp. 1001713B170207_170306_H8 TaxID=2787112 RepID=UPI00189A7256|nr:deaminase domain-containing protein [Romboutsia sp. 1001713B170207_170306_H8]
MTSRNIGHKNRKKEKIKISNIKDFNNALKKEGYNINQLNEMNYKQELASIFNVDISLINYLYQCIDNSKVTYRARDVKHFIDYVEKILIFENEHEKLCKEISKIKKLRIDRIEYDRKPSSQDNVDHILKIIDKMKKEIIQNINEDEKSKINELEEKISKDYLYSKDIELLKKMILSKQSNIEEKYDDKTQVKTILMDIPKNLDSKYIKPEKGSVEYHQHINSNIPRMKRLLRNMNKYIKFEDDKIFKINQSNTLQDSINIAVVEYDNQEFKAISGSNEIVDYCKAPPIDKQFFRSSKVNKLGKLGIGYNRINDSEKKIFEEIHKKIQSKELRNKGNLTLYSKWEPCPSCYFVINQFCNEHPDINVKIKYIKKYGEV